MDFLNFDVDDLKLDQFIDFNLEGRLYTFRFRHNSRDGWYISLYDPELLDRESVDNKAALLYGEVKIMPSQNILKFTASDKLPTGYLSFTDTELRTVEDYVMPSVDNIGTGKRFILKYVTRADMESLGLEWLL
ncbi:virion structural protein [Vibrio phage K460]